MLRLVLLLSVLLGFGAIVLTAPQWLPSAWDGTSGMVRAGAGLLLAGGVLLMVLSIRAGAPNRVVIPAFLIGTAVWLVPLLIHHMPAPKPGAAETAETQAPLSAPRTLARAARNAPTEDDPGGLGREIPIRADSSGHFFVRARVDGQWINFLVDTGATAVALTEADARSIGLHPLPAEFVQQVRTANGVTLTAPTTLGEVEVGPISIRQVQAIIARSGLNVSLLGMSFLSRLDGYSVRDGVLYMQR